MNFIGYESEIIQTIMIIYFGDQSNICSDDTFQINITCVEIVSKFDEILSDNVPTFF
jgi:hypothetical protein